jgi:hypothetical protein
MPRGSKPGERRGGRKKGTPNKRKLEAPSPEGETALQYLHRLMRDPNIEPARRDWAARMAVRYEQKAFAAAAGAAPGKKAAAEQVATTAGQGTEWGDDLDPSSTSVN